MQKKFLEAINLFNTWKFKFFKFLKLYKSKLDRLNTVTNGRIYGSMTYKFITPVHLIFVFSFSLGFTITSFHFYYYLDFAFVYGRGNVLTECYLILVRGFVGLLWAWEGSVLVSALVLVLVFPPFPLALGIL